MNSNTGEERGEEVFGRNLCNTLLAETSYNVEDAEEAGAAGEPGAAGCASQIPSAHSPLRKFRLIMWFFLVVCFCPTIKTNANHTGLRKFKIPGTRVTPNNDRFHSFVLRSVQGDEHNTHLPPFYT